MGFFKTFRKTNDRKANIDVLQAAAAAGVIIAGAEGGINKDELKGIENALTTHDKIVGVFSKAEIAKILKQYADLMEENPRLANTKLMREIEDIAENELDAEDVFMIAVSIAERDGDIGEKEMVKLKKIGAVLGQNVEAILEG